MRPLFADRADAARQLATRLAALALAPPVVVLALPRGGVPIGAEVARVLHAPLDLLLVRKIGAPGEPELAVAALVDAGGPELVIDEETCAATGTRRAWIEAQATAEWSEIERRRALYLRGRTPAALAGATAIVVDDGIATGTTVRAALRALRRRSIAAIVLAVPVAPPDTAARLAAEVDRFVCLAEPEPFRAVGCHYRDFHQVDDAEVVAALDAAAAP